MAYIHLYVSAANSQKWGVLVLHTGGRAVSCVGRCLLCAKIDKICIARVLVCVGLPIFNRSTLSLTFIINRMGAAIEVSPFHAQGSSFVWGMEGFTIIIA